MSPKIETLVEDIQRVLEQGVDALPPERLEEFNQMMGANLKRQLETSQPEGSLRMSSIGVPCKRKVWYSVNEYNNPLRENLRSETKFKFIYGDLTEELILFLAEVAGHDVVGRQDTQEIEGIKGHMDCIIDGCVVDVKSASTFGFKKFKEHRILEDDPFGYYVQIMSYLYASKDDPRVTVKDKAYFLAFDKQLGHICLDGYEIPKWFDQIPEMYRRRIEMVKGEVPDRDFLPVPDGKSGNLKLGTVCSYCDYKRVCHPGLRTFLYSSGPRHLTTVMKVPDVPEVTETFTDREYKEFFV